MTLIYSWTELCHLCEFIHMDRIATVVVEPLALQMSRPKTSSPIPRMAISTRW